MIYNLGLKLPLIAIALFVFYLVFGGKYVPKFLKKDKNAFLYIILGLVLCSYFGVTIEGLVNK